LYTEQEFDELCFEFGLELDEVVTEKDDAGQDEVVYKVSSAEVMINKYGTVKKLIRQKLAVARLGFR
jgi:hypothetical protein